MSSRQCRRRDLTPKQTIFVSEFLKDRNGKQAAIRAGYSRKTAEVQACELLRKPQVQAAVKRATDRLLKQNEITAARVLKEIRRVGVLRRPTVLKR